MLTFIIGFACGLLYVDWNKKRKDKKLMEEIRIAKMEEELRELRKKQHQATDEPEVVE